MRAVVGAAVTGLVVGAVGLGSAWAGASLMTAPVDPPAPADPGAADHAAGHAVDELARGVVDGASAAGSVAADSGSVAAPTVVAGERLPGGWFLVGTAERSLVPPADRWRPAEDCAGQAPEQLYTPLTPEGCLITFDMLWADGVDHHNPNRVRAVALSNGSDTVVFAVMDLVGYMAAYPADICADCGIAPIAAQLEAALGIPAQHIVISSSHTHAAPTTIAAGPAWYYEFIRDQVIAAITEAVGALADSPPVRLQTGAVAAKAYNTDRRLVNRAVPDYELGWLRAFVPAEPGGKGGGRPTAPTPERTVATIGNFAVHTTIRAGNSELHSGILGPFTRRLEDELGGAALFMPGAIGDQRADRGYGIYGVGTGLADTLIADIARGGHVLESNDIEVARVAVQVPIENQFFVAALGIGYAVRDFLPPHGGGPLAVDVYANGANKPVCQGAGALHVVTPVSAIRLGARPAPGKVTVGAEDQRPVSTDNVVIVQSPGEIFASIGVIVKDYLSRSNNVLIQGLTNDTIGYIIPENQYDLFGSQGLGIANNMTGLGNYEEALSLGRCTGELVMNAMLEVGQQLGVMGEGEGL